MLSDLEAAERAYERGDYAETRRRARAVLAGEATPEEEIRARQLLGRVSSDRAVLILLAACLVFFLVILLSYTGPRS